MKNEQEQNIQEQEVNEAERIENEELKQAQPAKIDNNLITQKKHRGLIIASILLIIANLIALGFGAIMMNAILQTLNSEETSEQLGGIFLAIIGLPIIIFADIFIFISSFVLIILHSIKLGQRRARKIEKILFIIVVAIFVLAISANLVFFITLHN